MTAEPLGGNAQEKLRGVVERIERLEEERRQIAGDIKDIYTEAKSAGLDVKVLRRLIRDRRREPEDVEEEESILELYRRVFE